MTSITFSIRDFEKCQNCGRKWFKKHTCLGKGRRRSQKYNINALHPDAAELLSLITYLGGSVPQDMLDRLACDKRVWGRNGNVCSKRFVHLPGVTSPNRCAVAGQMLQDLGMLSRSAGMWFATPRARTWDMSPADDYTWKVKAIQSVVHAFPSHRLLEPAYYSIVGHKLLPLLKTVSTYLSDKAMQPQLLHIGEEVVDVCISGSYFSDIHWKYDILATARSIYDHGPSEQIQALQARIEMRKMELLRISNEESAEAQIAPAKNAVSTFLVHDQLSNAHFGQATVFRARLFIDIGQHLNASSLLDEFSPWNADECSDVEKVQQNATSLLKGEIERYNGQFTKAESFFLELLKVTPTPPKVTTQLSAVLCELGKFDNAVAIIRDELQNTTNPAHLRNTQRLKLALAEAYLMKAARRAEQQKTIMEAESLSMEVLELIGKARHLLDTIGLDSVNPASLTKVGRINSFRSLFAFAVMEQVSGDPTRALERWDLVETASANCSWPEGFTNVIIQYSKSEIMYRMGNARQAKLLDENVSRLSGFHGRQYQINGFGTTWPDYIGALRMIRHKEQPLL